MLRRNKIYDGKESGVCVFSNGRGVLEDNEIFNNLLSGELLLIGRNYIVWFMYIGTYKYYLCPRIIKSVSFKSEAKPRTW